MALTFGDRLRQLLDKRGLDLQDIADQCGVTRQAVYTWMKGTRNPSRCMVKIAETLQVTPELLMHGTQDDLDRIPGRIKYLPGEDRVPPNLVPVKEYPLEAAAGGGAIPSWEDQQPSGICYYSAEYFQMLRLDWRRCILISAIGDSMEPLIHDGDRLLVYTELDPGCVSIRDGRVYVFSKGDDIRVKRLTRRLDGSLIVRSENPLYPEETIPPDEQYDVRIYGRVIEATRRAGF